MSSSDGAVSSVVDSQQLAMRTQIQYSILAEQLQAQKLAGQAAVDLLSGALQLSKEAGKGEVFDGVG
jgi:hypothetical protein